MLSVGDVWPAGAPVFVGASNVPLAHGQIAQLHPGDLIRFISAGLPVKRCVDLEVKIVEPQRWFSTEGRLESLSLDYDGQRHIGLVGVMVDWATILASTVSSVPALKQAVEGLCGRSERDFHVTAPRSQPLDLFFRRGHVADCNHAPCSCQYVHDFP